MFEEVLSGALHGAQVQSIDAQRARAVARLADQVAEAEDVEGGEVGGVAGGSDRLRRWVLGGEEADSVVLAGELEDAFRRNAKYPPTAD